MSLFRRIFRCSRGLHTPDGKGYCSFPTKHDLPRNYFRCEDCGQLFTSRGAAHEDIVLLRTVLDAIPHEHYCTLHRVGLIGLQPPEPWPTAPAGGFHGGPLPGLGDSPDLSNPDVCATLQAMLPQGSKSSVVQEPCSVMDVPAFDGRITWPDTLPEENRAHVIKLQELTMPLYKLLGGPFTLHENPEPRTVRIQGAMDRVPLPTWLAIENAIKPWGYNILFGTGDKASKSVAFPDHPVQKDPLSFISLIRDVDHIIAATQIRQAEHEVRGRFKDQIYGAIAETIAMLGTCCRLKVGCVLLTKEGRVAGLGYNGAGPGMDHCHEDHCNETCRCLRTLHAEQNALYSRNGDPYVAYVTHEPCLNCTKELALAGVRRVVYLKPYTSIAEAERTARQEWIDHYKITWEALNGSDDPA